MKQPKNPGSSNPNCPTDNIRLSLLQEWSLQSDPSLDTQERKRWGKYTFCGKLRLLIYTLYTLAHTSISKITQAVVNIKAHSLAMWWLKWKATRGKLCVRGTSEENCAVHAFCKPWQFLIQFIPSKCSCIGCKVKNGQCVKNSFGYSTYIAL